MAGGLPSPVERAQVDKDLEEGLQALDHLTTIYSGILTTLKQMDALYIGVRAVFEKSTKSPT